MNTAHLYTLATRVEQVERARQAARHVTTHVPLAQRLQPLLAPFARLVNYFATADRQAPAAATNTLLRRHPPSEQQIDVHVWIE